MLRSGHSLVQASRQILSKDASPHQLEIYMSEGWLILMPIAKPPTVRVGIWYATAMGQNPIRSRI